MRRLLFFFIFLLSIQSELFARQVANEDEVTLRVVIENIKNSKGDILLAAYNKQTSTFDADECYRGEAISAHLAQSGEVVFELKLPIGQYVFVAMHDENSNQEMDKNWIGFPTEDYAISNGLRIPNWKRALVAIDMDMELRMELK